MIVKRCAMLALCPNLDLMRILLLGEKGGRTRSFVHAVLMITDCALRRDLVTATSIRVIYAHHFMAVQCVHF